MRVLFIFIFLFIALHCSAQGFYFGPKGGINIATQKWGFQDRAPLLALHGDLFIESLDDYGSGSFYGQIGYHTRGSSARIRNILTNIGFTQGFKFNNISLGLGIKKRLDVTRKPTIYYMAGLRAEYTISTNLSEFEAFNANFFYPVDDFVKNFTYGITLGGGFEFEFNSLVQPFVEFAFMPDLGPQYDQFVDISTINPWTGLPQVSSAKMIRNTTIEITVGCKFLREVIYVD